MAKHPSGFMACGCRYAPLPSESAFAGLAEGFADQPRISNPAISEAAWRLLRAQRNLRRQLSRIRRYLQREFLAALFGAWRGRFDAAQRSAFFARRHRARIHATRVASKVRTCRSSCRAQSKLDQAAFTRDMFQTARSRDELPHLLRCVLRTGRRYKAPGLVPVMETSPGVVCATKDDFLAHAGRHFAQAERARPSTLAEMPALYRGHAPEAVLDVVQLPTLEDLTRAFSKLKSGRAPGLTGLAPEVYKCCPDLAAISHWPLALKAVSAGTQPLVVDGGCRHSYSEACQKSQCHVWLAQHLAAGV